MYNLMNLLKYQVLFLIGFSFILFSGCNTTTIERSYTSPPIISSSNKLENNRIKYVSTTSKPYITRSAQSSKGILHAIVVVNTNDRDIGSYIDLENVSKELKSIEKNTGLILRLNTMTKNNFKLNKVNNLLKQLSVAPNDVVIFYYSGHGFKRNQDKSRWPKMVLNNGRYLGLDEVVATLKEKNPRFFIAMSDSCSNFMSKSISKRGISIVPINPQNYSKNYQSLFLGHKGYIIAAAAKAGQYAAGSRSVGGIFTNQFLDSFKQEVELPNEPSWHRIIERAEKEISFKNQDGKNNIQNPQFEIKITSVEQIPVVTPERNKLSLQILPRQNFKVGQNMKIKVTNQGQKAAYVFVWDIGSDGKIVRVLPNNFAKKHYLGIQQAIQIPENTSSGFNLTMVEPLGKGIIAAILVDSKFKSQMLIEDFNSVVSTNAQNTLQGMNQKIMQLLGSNQLLTTINYNISY